MMKLKRLLFCCFKSEVDDETIYTDDITQYNAAEYLNAEEDSINQTNAVDDDQENSVVIEYILEENEIEVEDKEDTFPENNNQEVSNLIVPLTDNHQNLNGMKDIENVNEELAVSNVLDHVHHDNGEGNIIIVVEDKEDPIKDDNRHVPLLDNQENSIDVNDFETNKLEVSNVIKHDVQCAIDKENVDKEDIEQHHKMKDLIAVDDDKQTKSSENLLQHVVEDCDCNEEDESRSLTTKNIVHYDQEEKDISVVEEGVISHGDEETYAEDLIVVHDSKVKAKAQWIAGELLTEECCYRDEEEESKSFATEYNFVHNDLSVIKEGDHGNEGEESIEVDGNKMDVDCEKKYRDEEEKDLLTVSKSEKSAIEHHTPIIILNESKRNGKQMEGLKLKNQSIEIEMKKEKFHKAKHVRVRIIIYYRLLYTSLLCYRKKSEEIEEGGEEKGGERKEDLNKFKN